MLILGFPKGVLAPPLIMGNHGRGSVTTGLPYLVNKLDMVALLATNLPSGNSPLWYCCVACKTFSFLFVVGKAHTHPVQLHHLTKSTHLKLFTLH